MDLNLYLGLAPYLRPRSQDLGSDLALSYALWPSSSEESRVPATMSGIPSEPLEAHIPYSPTNPLYSPINENDDPFRGQGSPQERNGASYDPLQPIAQEPEDLNGPFMPPYDFELPSIPPWQAAAYQELFGPPSPPTPNAEPLALASPHSPLRPGNSTAFGSTGELSAPRDGATLLGHELLQSPEVRFQRLIESNERLQVRQNTPPDSNGPDELMCGIMTSQRSLMASGKLKVIGLGKAKEGSDDEKDGKSGGALNFECNICLDMAKEPVVTSCGHLFCWPCLYQWLHIHCDHKECPVCKGEVMESNIIPIYGRGISEPFGERKSDVEIADFSLEIPPRPHGQRVESLRQQLRNPEASARLRDGIATTWRRIIDGEISNAALHDTHDSRLLRLLNVAYRRTRETRSQRILNDANRNRTVTGFSAQQRMQMEGGNSEGVSNPGTLGNSPRPQIGMAASFQNGTDLSRQFPSLYDAGRFRAISVDIGRMVGSMDNNLVNHAGAAASPPQNAQNVEPAVSMSPAAYQASASSTMAVIEGDTTVQGAPAEPNIAGSSRVLRRRGRSSTSGSLDVDGGALHVRKRRRPN